MTSLLIMLLTAAPLTTVAEESGWVRTGRFDEVERLCVDFPARYRGKVKCERFGTTPQGRPMLAFIASADGAFTPEQTRAKKRPVVMLQGGIHAGEIDGKDAGFWLLREVLDGKVAPKSLNAVTLVFVPVFNVDGHERFGPNQRPNQRGPEQMGWRVTSQNLNLNRDYMKADAPEMIAMLALLHRFDPVLYVDLHVTDGAKFRHDVSITFEPLRLGPPGLQSWGRTLQQALFARLDTQDHKPVGFYPAFDDSDDPASGFTAGWPPPRFGNAYWALHHRFGVLVETHSWKPYAERVKATFDVCAGLLEEAALHGADWLASAQQADAAAMKLGGTDVVLMSEALPGGEAIDFLGYAYKREKSAVSGKQWVQYDESKPEVWKVKLRDELKPSLTVRAPVAGYVIPGSHAALVTSRLQAHALRFEVLKKGKSQVAVEHMVIDPKLRASTYEGRTTLIARGTWTKGTEDLPPGSIFIPIAQPHAEVVMHLLEPSGPDSFAAWGFFNAHLEQKEYLEDYLTELFAREQLKDPKVKAEFDDRLRDTAFAKDPEARLKFFADRHPSFDQRLNLLPVYRVDLNPLSN